MYPHIVSTTILITHWLIIVGLATRIVLRRPPVGFSLAWLAVICSVPFIGAGLYLLLGEKRLGWRRAENMALCFPEFCHWQHELKVSCEQDVASMAAQIRPLARHAENAWGFPVLSGNQIVLLASAPLFFDQLLKDIANANTNVLLGFYIWQPGGRTDEIINALIAAAERGVDCYALADAVGSKLFFKSDAVERLKTARVKLTIALPTGFLRTFVARADLRNHRKIAVIDDCIAYSGSQNLVDPKFFKQGSGVGEWVDAMVRITGPAATGLSGVFQLDWANESGHSFKAPACTVQSPTPADTMIQIVPSGPDLRPEAIHHLLLSAIYTAREELILTTPYFVPDDSMLTALITAAARGVQVTLIVPAHNDSVLVRFASAADYESLMLAGVKIACFNGGLLHTKSLAIDGIISMFGSVNLDMRSFWLNFEISLLIYDQEFTRKLRALQDNYLAQSTLLDLSAWRKRPTWRRFIENGCRLTGPML